jgi:DNA-binding response OmpR family regulator
MSFESNLTLLYVEDEDFIRENAVMFLEDNFKEIYEAENAFRGLEIYQEKNPDIIITDISMPKMSGLEMCERIRKADANVPIIITTAHTNTEYLLQAVELQLVKYLVKPIAEEQLIEALELCYEKLQDGGSNIINLGMGYTFDTFNLTLSLKGELIKLTQKERLFFKLLLKNPSHICSYQEIENYLFDEEGMSSNALRSLVKNVRKKTHKDFIINHSKMGYKIVLK